MCCTLQSWRLISMLKTEWKKKIKKKKSVVLGSVFKWSLSLTDEVEESFAVTWSSWDFTCEIVTCFALVEILLSKKFLVCLKNSKKLDHHVGYWNKDFFSPPLLIPLDSQLTYLLCIQVSGKISTAMTRLDILSLEVVDM